MRTIVKNFSLHANGSVTCTITLLIRENLSKLKIPLEDYLNYTYLAVEGVIDKTINIAFDLLACRKLLS